MMYDNVFEAFDLLMEEIEDLLESKRNEGAEAYRRGEISTFQEVDKTVRFLAELKESVDKLRYKTISFFQIPLKLPESKKVLEQKREVGAFFRGESHKRTALDATPTHSYRLVILEALSELGGKASSREVEQKVEEKMREYFRPDDLRPVSSGQIRWRKRLHWCRHFMVKEGLLRDDSPRGIWEITEQGWRELQKLKS